METASTILYSGLILFINFSTGWYTCWQVQAESRGDLRPDPRYDSINVVALAFENDSDHAVEIYVLLYCKSESHQRYDDFDMDR